MKHQEGRANLLAEDTVLVGFGHRGMAGMKGTSYRSRLEHSNGWGKRPIESPLQVVRRDVGRAGSKLAT